MARPRVLPGKTLAAGRIHSARGSQKKGGPAGHSPVGYKAHIGEVQASVWDEQTLQACRDAGVILL